MRARRSISASTPKYLLDVAQRIGGQGLRMALADPSPLLRDMANAMALYAGCRCGCGSEPMPMTEAGHGSDKVDLEPASRHACPTAPAAAEQGFLHLP